MRETESTQLHVYTLGQSSSELRVETTEKSQSRPVTASSSRPRISFRSEEVQSAKIPLARPHSAAVENLKTRIAKNGKAAPKNDTKERRISLPTPEIQLFPENTKKKPTTTRSRPIGAHLAGFYKKKAEKPVFKNVPSLAEMLKSVTIEKEEKEEKDVVNFRAQSTRSQNSTMKSRQSYKMSMVGPRASISMASFIQPDYNRIELHLSTLTDVDGKKENVMDAITHLVKLSQSQTSPSMPQVLYDFGIISVLIDILRRPNIWPEVQASACILIATVINDNGSFVLNLEDAKEEFARLDGYKHLISAAEASGRQYLDVKVKLEKKNNGWAGLRFGLNGKKTGMLDSTSVLDDSDDSANVLGVPEVKISSSDSQSPFKSIPVTKDTLIDGLLSKFYQSQFTDDLDRMDRIQRKQAVANLLSVIQKVDSLVFNNCFSYIDSDLSVSVNRLIEDTTYILGVSCVSLYMIDADKGEMYPFGGGQDSLARFEEGQGLVGLAAVSGSLIVARDPANHEKFSADIDSHDGQTPVSLMAIPLYSSDNHVIGVLEAENKLGKDGEHTYFTEEDEFFFKIIGSIGSSLLGNAKIYEAIGVTQNNIEVLLSTTKSLGSILQLEKLIKVIMDSAKELLSADRCALFLDDPERKRLKAMIQGKDSVHTISIPYTTGIAGAVFTQGESINIQDAYKDSRFNPEVDKQTGYVTRTILCMPIKNIHGECIGVMQMINKRKGVFTSADEMILSSFSAQAVAIEKSQLFKKTEDMRVYLQSVLTSINSCVVTLSETMKLNTINRPWFINILETTEDFVRKNSADQWIGESNSAFLNDIMTVYKEGNPIFGSEYEFKGKKSSVIMNYQIMPLIGTNGVVLVMDDISAEKRAVMTLGRYMSPTLAKQLMEDGNGALGGTRKKVSILFSDIRSFTTLSEGMEPTDVVDLLNHHFTDAVNAITEEQGILDKFIGDSVMAVFGVPFAHEDDAIHACNTALKMKDALHISNTARQAAGKQIIKIGVGINTGMVLSGNIGSVKRMEFSCIGDAVNLASRVEGLTKYYGITILITEFTLKETNDLFITREIESVCVQGKKKGVKMYELLGRKGDTIGRDIKESLSLYSAGLDLYKRRFFEQASEMFNAAITLTNDGPSKVLSARCEQFKINPPPETWDGTYIAEGK